MAPSGGGETKVKLTTPIGPGTSLELSGNGLLFDGEATKSITGSETTFNLTADNGLAAGTEVPLVLTLKNGASSVESVSTPIAAKVMKKRTIRVRVWRVKSDSGALPAFNPTQAELENYLNGVFQPQINAVFDCSMSSEIGPMNFDTAAGTDWGAPTNGPVTPGNGSLDFDPGYGHEMTAIRSGNYVSSFNINLYRVAVENLQGVGWKAAEKKFETIPAAGIALVDPNKREAWIAAGLPLSLTRGLDTIAHEIGHILLGRGHPDENGGVAVLPATPKPRRLMASGPKMRNEDGTSRIMVKGEWDEAKVWFDREINATRMQR